MKNLVERFVTVLFLIISFMWGAMPSANAQSIEELFAQDSGQKDLKQVGYNLFAGSSGASVGKYDSSYKLSIGESLDVYCWGDSIDVLSISGGSSLISPVTKTQVDAQGNLFVPGLGLVKAENRTIADVEKNLQSLASGKFTKAKVKITVADKSDFSVFVYGYVNKPSKVSIGTNSSIIDALGAAGGIQKTGSFRNITYKSNGKTQKVDLYNVIFKGNDTNIRLKPNDIIFVDKIGSVVALTDGVKVPGIYEVASADTLSTLIGFAGGMLPSSSLKTVNIRSYDLKLGERTAKDYLHSDIKSIKLKDGDIVSFSVLYGGTENMVRLEGSVKHPIVTQYKSGMRLSDLIKSKKDLQDETFMSQAVITRISGANKNMKVIPVSLESMFKGLENPVLQPRDVITVYSNKSNSFVEVYGCINMPKKVPFSDRLTLKDILADIQFTSSMTNDIVDVTNTNANQPEEQETVFDANTGNYEQTPSTMLASGVSVAGGPILEAENVAVDIINGGNVKTLYLYDVMVQSDTTQNIKIEKNSKVFFRPLRNEEIIKTVKVSGYVNRPGVYHFVEGKRILDMLEMAGGLKENANFKGIVFKRSALASKEKRLALDKNEKDLKLLQGLMVADTGQSAETISYRQRIMENISAETQDIVDKPFAGRISLNIPENDINSLSETENLLIQDGDEIYIPKIAEYVIVMGEVYNESSFVYKKGAKADYYVDLVGGFTQNARPSQIYKLDINGKAKKIGQRKLTSTSIEPGDAIIIPRRIRGKDWIATVMQTTQSIVNTMLSILIVTKY